MQTVSSCSWFDIFGMTAGCGIDNLDNILSLPLFSWCQSWETPLENIFWECFLMTIRAGISNLVPKNDINTLYLTFSFSVIKLAIDSGIFSRNISILLEETLNSGDTLIDTATWSDLCLHLLMIIFDGGHLSEDNLSFGSQQQESIIEPTNEGLHFVFYTTSSVALGGFILNKWAFTMKDAGQLSPVLKEKGKEYWPAGMKLPPKLNRTVSKRAMLRYPVYLVIYLSKIPSWT